MRRRGLAAFEKGTYGQAQSVARKAERKQPEFVHQFLVVLSGTDPLVWRRLQVLLTYSFWDLHVAIQDSMGWLDYHLHEFRVFENSRDAGRSLRKVGSAYLLPH